MSEQDCRTLRGAVHALAEGRKRRAKDGPPLRGDAAPP
jgi:hypothetical protein